MGEEPRSTPKQDLQRASDLKDQQMKTARKCLETFDKIQMALLGSSFSLWSLGTAFFCEQCKLKRKPLLVTSNAVFVVVAITTIIRRSSGHINLVGDYDTFLK